MDGVLNICKPQGPTSHDVVNRVRRLFGQKRVGHAGTLDPMATGVLLVCLGNATRIVEYLTAAEKTYRATMTLGMRTDTEDSTGSTTSECDASGIGVEAVREATAGFVGEIVQIPPMISAIKHQGKPLYKHAREGRTIERPGRTVTVYSVELVDFRPGPRAETDLLVRCSSGTYIRTLCADIGDVLGCGGMMSSLERTSVGPYCIDRSVPLDELEAKPEDYLIPVAEALGDMPAIEVDADGAWRIVHGLETGIVTDLPGGCTVAVKSGGRLLAIGAVAEDGASVKPRKVLAAPGDCDRP